MLGIALLYVGAVLFVNALWLFDKAEAKSTGVLNAFVGVLIIAMALSNQFQAKEMSAQLATAQSLLFGFTYLWVAVSCFYNLDNRALGYYCLFVAIVALPTAILTFIAGDSRFGVIWLTWGFLWFLFFLLLGLGKPITKVTAYVTMIIGIMTGTVGYLILVNLW
jgi:uncharacterized membrane protein